MLRSVTARSQCLRSGTVSLLLSLLIMLTGCDSDKSARHVGPVGPATMSGQWRGTLTAVYQVGNDTLSNFSVKTRITFDDTSFTYRHVDDYGNAIPPYEAVGPYLRSDTLVELQDTTTYDAWVDRSITPIIDEPYRLTLSYTVMVLHWRHDYGSGIVRSQRIDLRKVQ